MLIDGVVVQKLAGQRLFIDIYLSGEWTIKVFHVKRIAEEAEIIAPEYANLPSWETVDADGLTANLS